MDNLRPPAPVAASVRDLLPKYRTNRPRTYSGAHLEYVLMPLGGIGAGSIWLDGQGRLAVWQIFNNFSENRIPDSFFAIRARVGAGTPVVRVLQTVPEAGFPAMQSLQYEGGYPIARLAFTDPSLPVTIRLEAFNPMIPGDAANSALPCAIFRITARNAGQAPAHVDVLASLQNAVGSRGDAGINGVSFPRYGGNTNILVRDAAMSAIFMHRGLGDAVPGAYEIRDASGVAVHGSPAILFIDRLGGDADPGPLVQPLTDMTARAGAVVCSGVSPSFFQTLTAVQAKVAGWKALEVFEDFEKGTYDGWTVRGDAFAQKPSSGTNPNQNPVSGFLGKYLINSYPANDDLQGDMTSRPFTIHRRFLGFLIGGGAWAGETCLNLLIDGKVVRTATGRNDEHLAPASWDVSDLAGKQAVLQIVDHRAGGWGHINLDHIVFSDEKPDDLLNLQGPLDTLASRIGLTVATAETATAPAGAKVQPTDAALGLKDPWPLKTYTRLTGLSPDGFHVLATAPNGDPLILLGPVGDSVVAFCLAPDLPWSWTRHLFELASGRKIAAGERLASSSPDYGSMALSTPDPSAPAVNWTDGAKLATQFAAGADLAASPDLAGSKWPAVSPIGQTVNGALTVPLKVPAGAERTATFVISWHFPNADRFGHPGNLYARHFSDARAVAAYVNGNLGPLWDRTRLYWSTVYQSNLPEDWLDAVTAPSCILRGPTCFWSADGYFGGFEGSYGCCPLNCTHVWNYAQTHARLFPQVGRNMRESDLLVYMHPTGETSHRQHAVHNAFADGQAAALEAALREHQLSPDAAFLDRLWPAAKKATDWFISSLDPDRDGVPSGLQWNTYDSAVSGANTFIGSQYLSALAAAERLAIAAGDKASASRYRQVLDAGMKNQDARLWGGEYYLQVPDPQRAQDYINGCHIDQLLGQWWALQLGLGYLYPRDHVRSALAAIEKYNFRETFVGFHQAPRRYLRDDEAGLLMCTWPKNDRPQGFIYYADEVWSSNEYRIAAAMIYEGMFDSAGRLLRAVRARMDGRRRDGVDNGPGGNPFNDLECGKFYARAMDSWSILLAAQGLILDGPSGLLGFKPNWKPDDHRSFFTAAEGWGLFAQSRKPGRQSDRIEVRNGRLKLRELVFALPDKAGEAKPEVVLDGKPVAAVATRTGDEIRLSLAAPTVVAEGSAINVTLTWTP
jgi:uncharacterized protein (DUF608 family)